MFLQRSATLELDIKIVIIGDHCTPAIIEELGVLFAPHTTRITRLQFITKSGSTALIDFLGEIGSNFPGLRFLSTSEGWEAYEVVEIDETESVSFIAPRLESLVLVEAAPWQCHALLSVVASENLTRVTAYLFNGTQLCSLLRCPCLRDLDLNVAHFQDSEAHIQRDINLAVVGSRILSIRVRETDPSVVDNCELLNNILDWALRPTQISVDIEVVNFDTSSSSQRDLFQRIHNSFADVDPVPSAVARCQVLLKEDFRLSTAVGARRRVINSPYANHLLTIWQNVYPANIAIFTLDTTRNGLAHSRIPPPVPGQSEQGARAYFPALKRFKLHDPLHKLGRTTTCDPLEQYVSRDRACTSLSGDFDDTYSRV